MKSPRHVVIALALCFFFGCLGIHRFYVGKIGTGLFMLFTFGGLGLWAFIDFIIIATGTFKDSDGKELKWDDIINPPAPAPVAQVTTEVK